MNRVDTTVQVTVFAGTWVGSGASLGKVGSVPLCSCRGPCSRGPWFGNFLVSLSLGKWCFLPFSELSLSAPITLGLVSGIRCCWHWMCPSSPHFFVLALAPWQQSILCWGAAGLWVTWKSNSCEVCKEGLCVNMAPSVHGPSFAFGGTRWQSPTLTLSCRSERIPSLGCYGSKLIPVSQPYLTD